MSVQALKKDRLHGQRPPLTLKNLPGFLGEWLIRNKFYFLAFAVPVLIMYIAYAMFQVYPFGDNSVLVLDLNGQYVYYFESIRDAFWGDESIFYNWSRNLSGGYAGVIGYYLASPLTLIPILLPRTMILGSLQIMILTKLGLASVTMSYYLRKSRDIAAIPATLFGSAYALCAYGVIQAMDPMWLDGVYLLPMVILGVEYLVDDGRKLNMAIPLAMIFVFNFYIGYIVGIFTVLYFLFYAISGGNEKKRMHVEDIVRSLGRFVISGGTALLLSAFMILMVYNALKLGKFDFTEPDFSFKTQFNPLEFFMQLMPAQYDTVNVEGLPEIYCGVLTVVMIPLFYMNKAVSINKKVGYTAILMVLFLCMYIRPIDMVWHGFQMPNWLPFRYSFTFSFILVTMGAVSYSKLEGIKASAVGGSAFCMVCYVVVCLSRADENRTTTEILIAGGLALAYCGIIFIFRNNKKALSVTAAILLLVMGSGERLYNCYNTFKDEDSNLVYSKGGPYYNFINNGREVSKMIQQYNADQGNANDGFYRADKTFHRTVNDCSAMELRGISHSSSVMNAKILTFLEALGFSASTYYTRFDGDTPITDAVLGVKYSIDKIMVGEADAKRKTNETFNPIFSYEYKNEDDKDARMDVFENPNALSLGYMANENIRRVEKLGNDNTFMSQNILFSTLTGNTTIENSAFSQYHEYFKPMNFNPDDPTQLILSDFVTTEPYGNQTLYRAGTGGDPVVNMHLTPQNDDNVYFYFQTENQKAVNLWLSTEKDENGNYINHKFVGAYFEGHDYHTVNLGSFEPNQEFELRMTVANEYTIINNFLFYQFDEELFQQDVERLKANQWNITEFDGNYIKGTINNPYDVNDPNSQPQLMFTSIPFEEGWTIKVDGETLNYVNKDTTEYDTTAQCYTMLLKSLYGIKLTPGEHTVEMSYTPPGFVPGMGLFVVGIACVVLIYMYDRKNNKVLIARRREKNGNAAPTAAKSKKKKAQKTAAKEGIYANDFVPEEVDLEDIMDEKMQSQAETYTTKTADTEATDNAAADAEKQTAKPAPKKPDAISQAAEALVNPFIKPKTEKELANEATLNRLDEAEAKLKAIAEKSNGKAKGKGKGKGKKGKKKR